MRPARISGLAILVLAVALAACGGREEPAAPEPAPADELPAEAPEPAADEATAPEPATEPATEPAPAEEAPEAEAPPAETAAVAQPSTIDFEIYKAGFSPEWQLGLDLFRQLSGVPAVVIPHYDNAEGGHHDTRLCSRRTLDQHEHGCLIMIRPSPGRQ